MDSTGSRTEKINKKFRPNNAEYIVAINSNEIVSVEVRTSTYFPKMMPLDL